MAFFPSFISSRGLLTPSALTGLVVLSMSWACSGGTDGNPSNGEPAGTGGDTVDGSGGTNGGSGGGSTGTGGMVSNIDATEGTLVGACRAYVTAQCTKALACGADYPEGYDCAESAKQACPDAVFSEGSLRTREGTLACAEEWEAFSCSDLEAGLLPACVTTGTIPNGEGCVFTSQCAEGECQGGNVACGVCVPLSTDTYCEPEVIGCPGLLSCDSGVCRFLKTDTVVPEEPIDSPSYPKLGEECTNACVDAVCVVPPGGGPTRCMGPLNAGDTCYTNAGDTESYSCGAGNEVTCGASLTCEARPPSGAPCLETSGGGFACRSGDYCGMDMLCHTPALGDACNDGPWQCRPQSGTGLECKEGICQSTIALGESCGAAFTVCEQGSKCEAGTCIVDDESHRYGEVCLQ